MRLRLTNFHPIPSVLLYICLQVWEAAHKACPSAEHFSRCRGLGETAVAAQTAAVGSESVSVTADDAFIGHRWQTTNAA